MKKILLVAAIASTFMAFAEGEAANATEVQQIGITAITTSRQSVIVAFSYKGSDGGKLTADKLVKTTNLTVDDKLHAYVYADDGSGEYKGKYKSWVLARTGTTGPLYWTPYSESNEEHPNNVNDGTEAADFSQAVGTGIWLIRQHPTEVKNGNVVPVPFYIYGTPATEKEITVTKGTTMLIGNPNSGEKAPTIANAAVGDAIYIPNGKALIKYTYGSNGRWNKGFTELGENETPTFDANTGAWYEAKAKVAETDEDVVTITW